MEGGWASRWPARMARRPTTGLIAFILDRAGLDPSFIVGALWPITASTPAPGTAGRFVVEADEYDRIFFGAEAHGGGGDEC
jgi:UDP-N-acetylmuramate: L-alanyl-gamma-D-glutamyl-meso-diaminopimelate ligase